MTFELSGEAARAVVAVLMSLGADPDLATRTVSVETAASGHLVTLASVPTTPGATGAAVAYPVAPDLAVGAPAQNAKPGAGAKSFPGLAARAVSSAAAAHRAGGHPDLLNYDVEVTVQGAGAEVVFVPRTAPGEKRIRGGRTSLGPEVRYEIDYVTGRVLGMSFAR